MAIEDRTSPLDRLAARSTIGGPPAGEPMLIDRSMPSYDAVRVEHRIAPGDVRPCTPRLAAPTSFALGGSPSRSGCHSPPAASVCARFR
jgi:hypothetical protein